MGRNRLGHALELDDDDAVNFTLSKARQIVDLQGDRIFEER